MNRNVGVWLAILIGVFLGIGFTTFNYAKGLSYFSKDPKACINCHIMQPQYDSWQKASHHAVASCVDCHLPHDFVGKYMAKAKNGYHHSKGFTFQDFHEPIMIKRENSEILQNNCVRCHGPMVHDIMNQKEKNVDSFQCVHCHATAGHGERTGMGRIS